MSRILYALWIKDCARVCQTSHRRVFPIVSPSEEEVEILSLWRLDCMVGLPLETSFSAFDVFFMAFPPLELVITTTPHEGLVEKRPIVIFLGVC
ncbi:hypothetical protein BSKO_05792 [Bryopsis sp. KO-2023]|nr:hypothetical protein BSKO_05792 [Bryopsis sp. KO-2023]